MVAEPSPLRKLAALPKGVAELIDAVAPYRPRLSRVSRLFVEAQLAERNPEDLSVLAKYDETASDRDGAYLRECKALQDEMLDAGVGTSIECAFESLPATIEAASDVCSDRGHLFVTQLLIQARADGKSLAEQYREPGLWWFWAALKAVGKALNCPEAQDVEAEIKRERGGMARMAEYRRALRDAELARELRLARQGIPGRSASTPDRRQLAADVAAVIRPVIDAEIASLAKQIDATPTAATPTAPTAGFEVSPTEGHSRTIGKLTTDELDRVDAILCQILDDRPRITRPELLEALKSEPRAPWCKTWKISAFEAAFLGRKKRDGAKPRSYPSKFPRAKSKWDALHGV